MKPLHLVALALLAALGACGQQPPAGDSLFPLDAGHRWTYRVTTEFENQGIEHEQLTLSNHGRDDLDDQPTWRRRSDGGVEYWLRDDETGVYRVASKSDVDAEPRPDAARRYVLKEPLIPGTQWQADTTAYLLKRRADFPREIRHTRPGFPMTYTIDAVGESVDTRAGRFAGCMRVQGKASLKLYADPVKGWRDMPITTTEWYCPGVGLVRLERREPANSAFLIGGSLTMDLESWQ